MYLMDSGAPSRKKKKTHISKCAFRVDTEVKTSQDAEAQILRDTMHSARPSLAVVTISLVSSTISTVVLTIAIAALLWCHNITI